LLIVLSVSVLLLFVLTLQACKCFTNPVQKICQGMFCILLHIPVIQSDKN